ncbi:hypothetical protein MTO96_031616 [Rhipicephalus appendiculatus]
MMADEKLPALTDMRGKNSNGSPRKQHQKQRKAKGRSQSPSTSSRLPVVPESPRDSKLVVSDEGAKESAGEGQRSDGTKEAEAKATVAATEGDGGQPTATKGDGSQANEDGPKRKVSLKVPEVHRQRKACETPSQSSRYTEVPSRPSLVEAPPDDPRGEMFLFPALPGAAMRDLKGGLARTLELHRDGLRPGRLRGHLLPRRSRSANLRKRLPKLHTKGLAALERMPGLCNSTDCEVAVREVIGTADPYADPCGDLQAFTCGRWCTFANSTWAPTYWREQRRRYVSDVEATVMFIYRRALFTGQPFHYMGSFYASCRALLRNRKASVVDCWDAAGVVLEEWTNAGDFTTLLDLAVHTIVSSGVPSVFKISNYNDATVEVDTGMAIATTETDDRFRQMLVEEAATELGMDAEPLGHNVRNIDDAVRAAIEEASKDAPDRSLACSYFDTASVKKVWCEVFRRHRTLYPTAWQNISIASSDDDLARATSTNSARAIRSILEALGSADLGAAKVYLLLVPLARFMVLEYLVRPLRGKLSAGAMSEVCVRTLQAHVNEVFGPWFRTRVVRDGTATDVPRMIKDVRDASSATFKRFKGATIDEEALDATMAWVDALITDSRGPVPTVPTYGDDFVANMIRLSRSGASVTRDELTNIATMAGQSAGSHGVCGSNDTTVDGVSGPAPPTVAEGVGRDRDLFTLLLPDVYYSDSNRKVLNYGSLGTLLAGKLFDMAQPRPDLSAHASCLARYVSANFGVTLSEDERVTVLKTAWSLETAHMAAALREPDVARGALETRLFVLRFLRMTCGEPEDVARLSRIAVMTLPIYTMAFNCSSPSTPALC